MKQIITADDFVEALGSIDDSWYDLALEPVQKRGRQRFVGYEIRKLLGVKYLWVFLVIFILANSLIAFFAAGRTRRRSSRISSPNTRRIPTS